MTRIRTAADATPREIVAATILRAYYDGRRDQAMMHGDSLPHRARPHGLDKPPDADAIVRLLWEEDDDATQMLRQRALNIADAVCRTEAPTSANARRCVCGGFECHCASTSDREREQAIIARFIGPRPEDIAASDSNDNTGGWECPSCARDKFSGHSHGCALIRVLRISPVDLFAERDAKIAALTELVRRIVDHLGSTDRAVERDQSRWKASGYESSSLTCVGCERPVPIIATGNWPKCKHADCPLVTILAEAKS